MKAQEQPTTGVAGFASKSQILASSSLTTDPPASENEHVDTCTMCWEPITDRAILAPCNHWTFDLLCVMIWFRRSKTCPTCRAEVKFIDYDFRDPDEFDRLDLETCKRATYSRAHGPGFVPSNQSLQAPMPRYIRRSTPAPREEIDPALEKRK